MQQIVDWPKTLDHRALLSCFITLRRADISSPSNSDRRAERPAAVIVAPIERIVSTPEPSAQGFDTELIYP
jgi:hypothetical protein